MKQLVRFNELFREFNFENKIESYQEKLIFLEDLVYDCYNKLDTLKNKMDRMRNHDGSEETSNPHEGHK